MYMYIYIYMYISMCLYVCVCVSVPPPAPYPMPMAQTTMEYIYIYTYTYIYVCVYLYIYIKWALGVLASNPKWVGSSMLKHETTATACQAHERPPLFIGQIRSAEAMLKHAKRKPICLLGT